MEPIRSIQPAEGFLEHIRERTRRENVSLVLDEVSSGWRSAVGGAHLVFGLEPDIAVFAKGMSNGYPMAAVIGRKTTMDAAQDTFISSTYWTDRIGPSAAIASIEKMRHKQVYKVLAANGQAVKTAWKTAAEQANLEIHISGIDPLAHFDFTAKDPFALKSLFTKFMLDKGFLATNAFYASYAHNKEEINAYSKATAQSFLKIKHAIETDTIGSALGGPVCHSGFQRLA